MSSVYLFFLELVLTSVVANDMKDQDQNFNGSAASNRTTDLLYANNETSSFTTISVTNISEFPNTTEGMNASDADSHITTTPQNSKGLTETNVVSLRSSANTVSKTPSATPPPISGIPSRTKEKDPAVTKKSTSSSGDSNTGIIILIVIFIILLLFGVACFLARRREGHYSVDFTSRVDENVPLSTVEPELPVESSAQNGLKTFESTETAAKEPEEPEVAPETQEEKKEEAALSAAAPSTKPAASSEAPAAASTEDAPPAPAPPPDGSEETPKDAKESSSAPAESSSAPAEPPLEDKTDDEGMASNKTSVESLKDTNENNSNNFGFSQMSEAQRSNALWDVPLDCPV